MNIQSISIVVPTKKCINKCKFCVSCMHDSPYINKFDEIQYRKRIKYASNNGVNSLIITGDNGEILQNSDFLENLVYVLDKENHPFPNVEIQTVGSLLMDKQNNSIYSNIRLLRRLGVNTISLSISDIFDSENNWDIIDAPKSQRPPLYSLCNFIKDNGFNLRLSLNMTSIYNNESPEQILHKCKDLMADQVTFRKLYNVDDNSSQSLWVRENACKNKVLNQLDEWIGGTHEYTHQKGSYRGYANGKMLYKLPFGGMAYSIMGMSTVIDDNCMSKEENEKLKYVILRENGKLYCQWDDEGSLIF